MCCRAALVMMPSQMRPTCEMTTGEWATRIDVRCVWMVHGWHCVTGAIVFTDFVDGAVSGEDGDFVRIPQLSLC